MADIVTTPLKFLNATVLSFNTSLGLGGSESTLNVDLIEDCEADPPDQFLPAYNLIEVGAPVYFSTCLQDQDSIDCFTFGGVLTSWTVNQGGSGKTYNTKVSDPRQLLENTIENVLPLNYKNFGGDQGVYTYYFINNLSPNIKLDDTCEFFLSTYLSSVSWFEKIGDRVKHKLKNTTPMFVHDNGWNYGSPRIIETFNLI